MITTSLSVSAISRGVAIAPLAALLLLIGCERGGQDVKTSAAPPPPPPPPSVIVSEVLRRPVPVVRDFVARTEGIPTVEIRARVQGVLEGVQFKEGSEVREGQVLFVIQQDEYKAALRSAQAQLAKAQADLTRARDMSIVARAEANVRQAQADLGKSRKDVARYQPLVKEQAIPLQDLDAALSQEEVGAAAVDVAQAALADMRLQQRTQIELSEASVEAAQAAVTQAELNLGYTTIRSPISGIIGKIQVDRGNLVGKGEPTLLTTVSAVDPIFADFSITDADLLYFSERIRAGAQGRGRPARGDLELVLSDGSVFPQKGRPIFVDRAVDPKTGTIGVRAEFPNPQKVLRPGQFARVRAVVEELSNAVLVPQLAIQELQGNKAVLVVGPGDKAMARNVTLGDRYQQFYVVTRGLEGGERVIVEGGQKVRPGMQVAPVLRPEESRPPSPAAAPAKGAAAPAPTPAAGARPGG